MSKIVTGKNDIHQDTGASLSQLYTGTAAEWQTFGSALTTFPSLKSHLGVPENLKIIVLIPEAKEKGKGNFRDCRWDYAALNFVDVATGETYGKDDVQGWTVGAFPF
ncbi:MAG TPA: hypothetical protein VIE69_02405 [Methylophilaceae bacterium]|jgi:hypothetical protein